MGRIIHAEITVEDIDRATAFYEHAFGWKGSDSPFVDGYRTAETGPGEGIDGALMSRSHESQPAVVWLAVDDLDATLGRVREAGGSTDHPVNVLPGQGRVVYVRDSEGTLLGLKGPV